MGTIAKVTAGGSTHLIASSAYGTCDTAAATAAKVATIQDSQAFSLITGVTVHIKFTYANGVANPTLNVNSTGAKSIMRYGTTAPSTNANTSWNAGSVVSFTYDGTYWQMNDFGLRGNDNTTYSAGTGLSLSSTTFNHSNSVTAQATQAVYPIKIDAQGHISAYGSAVTSMTPASHTHGNITNAGDITTTATIASGDRIVINDESESKVTNSSITFGTGTTTYLRNDGTWGTPAGTSSGTITGIKMNGSTVGTSGVVDLGTVLTSHQDISGKQDKITAITAQTTQAVYPIKIDSQGHITAYGSAVTSMTPASHTHGKITNAGDITTTVAIASGDRLVINDESASELNNSTITFGTSTTTFLRNDGTWGTPSGGTASTITESTTFNISGTTFNINLVT